MMDLFSTYAPESAGFMLQFDVEVAAGTFPVLNDFLLMWNDTCP